MRRNRAFMKRNLDSMRYWMFDGVRCEASMIVEAALNYGGSPHDLPEVAADRLKKWGYKVKKCD